MNSYKLVEFYKMRRTNIRFSLRIFTIITQLSGFLFDHLYPASNFGSVLMIFGLAVGFALLIQSNSIREAGVNIIYSTLPIPGVTILMICLVSVVSVIFSGFDTNTMLSIQKVAYAAFTLLTLVLIASWPFLACALGAKALFLKFQNSRNVPKK